MILVPGLLDCSEFMTMGKENGTVMFAVVGDVYGKLDLIF